MIKTGMNENNGDDYDDTDDDDDDDDIIIILVRSPGALCQPLLIRYLQLAKPHSQQHCIDFDLVALSYLAPHWHIGNCQSAPSMLTTLFQILQLTNRCLCCC